MDDGSCVDEGDELARVNWGESEGDWLVAYEADEVNQQVNWLQRRDDAYRNEQFVVLVFVVWKTTISICGFVLRYNMFIYCIGVILGGRGSDPHFLEVGDGPPLETRKHR